MLLMKLEMEGYSQHKILDCDPRSIVSPWLCTDEKRWTKMSLQSDPEYAYLCTIYVSQKGTHLEGILQIGYFLFHNTF